MKPRWPMEAPKWTPLYIEWVDAVDHSDNDATWQSLSEIDAERPKAEDGMIWQCGLLYDITDTYITIVYATDKTEQVLKPFQIPRSAITKIRKLKI